MNVNGIGAPDPVGTSVERAARPPAPPLRTNEAVPPPPPPAGRPARQEPATNNRAEGPRQDAADPKPTGTRLRVDPETRRIVAQIVNEEGEVIKQLPPEDLLELSVRFRRLEGLLFDRES